MTLQSMLSNILPSIGWEPGSVMSLLDVGYGTG